MKTVTLPEWVVERLAALPPGETALVVLPVVPKTAVPTSHEYLKNWKNGYPPDMNCPLGAVGERVAVRCDLPGGTVCRLDQSCDECIAYLGLPVRLTAEPEVKRVGEMTEVQARAAGVIKWTPTGEDAEVCGAAPAYRLPHRGDFAGGWSAVGAFVNQGGYKPDAWAWFCKVEVTR